MYGRHDNLYTLLNVILQRTSSSDINKGEFFWNVTPCTRLPGAVSDFADGAKATVEDAPMAKVTIERVNFIVQQDIGELIYGWGLDEQKMSP